MTQTDMRKLLHLDWPQEPVCMVLDTDAYNEVDDQYAIAYALLSPERLRVEAIYAAPFYATPFYPPMMGVERASSPADGMEKSHAEILHILRLMGRDEMSERVYKGAEQFIGWQGNPVESPAAADLAVRALAMTGKEKLYVVAIGAITNVASALLLYPEIREKIVVIWLGGHAFHWRDNAEFNCMQDPYAAKAVFDSGVPVVHLPCMGVVNQLLVTFEELKAVLADKNPLCDYLYQITRDWSMAESGCKLWSKPIWDIATVAWLVGGDAWVTGHLVHSPVITAQNTYSADTSRHFILQVQHLDRDQIWADVAEKLASLSSTP